MNDITCSSSNRVQDLDSFFSREKIRIYGRAQEYERLLQVYNRIKIKQQPFLHTRDGGSHSNNVQNAELVILQGESGVGKTTLAHSLRSIVEHDGGYFISGKFDKLRRFDPVHTAFLSALTDFAKSVIERQQQETIRKLVRERHLEECGILSELVPDLQQVLESKRDASSPSLADPGFASTCNQFKNSFNLFLKAVSSSGSPIIMLLDDLQWADSVALDVLYSVMTEESSHGGFLMVLTTRLIDETEGQVYSRWLTNMESYTLVTVTTITLQNVDEVTMNSMISEILINVGNLDTELTSNLYKITKGNIMFTLGYLYILLADRKLYDEWIMDNNSFLLKYQFNSKFDLIGWRYAMLADEEKEFLKTAACLGTKIDCEIIERLWSAETTNVQESLISANFIAFDRASRTCEFVHDSVHETVYNQIEESQIESYHYRIGKKLWKILNLHDVDKFIFVVVGQLILGSSLIRDPRERIAVAKLCLRAGEQSAQLSRFQSSFTYFQSAISILGPRSWHEEYQLCLCLHNLAAEVAYGAGKIVEVNILVKEILQHSRIFEDTLRARITEVYTAGSSGQMGPATETGLQVLKDLGISFPRTPRSIFVLCKMKLLKRRLKHKTNEQILSLPVMEDMKRLAVMQMLNVLFLNSWMVNPNLAFLIGIQMINETLNYGLNPVVCMAFAIFGTIVFSLDKDYEVGYRLAKLSLSIYEKFGAEAWLARLSAIYYSSLHNWKRTIRESLEPLKKGYRTGLQTGDIEYAMLCYMNYICASMEFITLTDLLHLIDDGIKRMEFYGQQAAIMNMKPSRNFVLKLMTSYDSSPIGYTFEPFNENVSDASSENKLVVAFGHFHQMILFYMFGKFENALEHSKKCRLFANYPFNAIITCSTVFYDALILIACARTQSRRRYTLQRAKRNCYLLQCWAGQGTVNFLVFLLLVEAELADLFGKYGLALSKYTTAIIVAKHSEYMYQTALANELMARYLYRKGDKIDSIPFFREAVACYTKWGALAKTDHLENEINSWDFSQ